MNAGANFFPITRENQSHARAHITQDAENKTVEGIAGCKQQVNMNSIIFIAFFLVIGGLGKPSPDNELTDGIDEEEMQADIEAQFKSINVSWSKHIINMNL